MRKTEARQTCGEVDTLVLHHSRWVLQDEQSHPQEVGMEVHRTISVCALGDSPLQMSRIKAQSILGHCMPQLWVAALMHMSCRGPNGCKCWYPGTSICDPDHENFIIAQASCRMLNFHRLQRASTSYACSCEAAVIRLSVWQHLPCSKQAVVTQPSIIVYPRRLVGRL